jgi:hypothetical protein
VVGLQRTWWLGVTIALFFACGEKFVGVDAAAMAGDAGEAPDTFGASGGAAGSSSAGKGGKASAAGASGRGGAAAGAEGVLPGVGGVLPGAGEGGLGTGGMVVEPPAVPQDRLELWFDAEEGVTSSPAGVSIWKDRSVNGRDALQTSVDLRPTLVADGLNGKPTIVFDGQDDYFELPALAGDFTRGVSIFVVGQTDGTGACMAYFEASNGSEVDDVHLGFWESRYLYEVAEIYLQVELAQQQGSPEVVVGIQQPTGAVEVRRNSNAIGKSQFELPVLKPREHVFLAKTEYGNCSTLKGRMSEVLVYSRSVSAKELLTIEDYLSKKWACCSQ